MMFLYGKHKTKRKGRGGNAEDVVVWGRMGGGR
jgi:hypothetical protein